MCICVSVLYGVLEKRGEREEGKLLNRFESRKDLDKSRREKRKCEFLRYYGVNFF